jgi:hypothetical protein
MILLPEVCEQSEMYEITRESIAIDSITQRQSACFCFCFYRIVKGNNSALQNYGAVLQREPETNSFLEMLILQRWKMTKEVKRVSSCSSALSNIIVDSSCSESSLVEMSASKDLDFAQYFNLNFKRLLIMAGNLDQRF